MTADRCILCLLACLTAADSTVAAEFVDLFNGTDTQGWSKPFDWGQVHVQDEQLVLSGSPKYFLVTERRFRDFELQLELNVPQGGNSGVQFRCHFRRNRLWGYQAEVDTSDRKWSGGLYEEGRRGWLVPLKDRPAAQAAFQNGKWNHYRIRAVGDHIQIWVNGIQTVDHRDAVDREGHIALQHHGEAGKVYRFRNVRIQEIAAPRVVSRIGLGSCIRQDRPQPIWKAVHAFQPELFVMLGDNIYGDSEDMNVLQTKYRRLGADPGFAALRKQCPLLAVWDDHDYGVNDGGAEYPRKKESQALFNDFFEVPQGNDRRRRPGTYDSQVIGPTGKRIQFILLDTRYFRSPLKAWPKNARRTPGPYRPNDDPQATVLGAAQWKWLEEQLQVPAELRIVASSIQFLPEQHGWEMWANFPGDRQRFLDLLARHDTGGVIFISGDRHLAEISRMETGPNNSGFPIYDLTSSSLNQPSGGGNEAEANRHRIAGNHYTRVNFGSIVIDWEPTDPTLTLSIHDLHGAAVRRHRLSLGSLRGP